MKRVIPVLCLLGALFIWSGSAHGQSLSQFKADMDLMTSTTWCGVSGKTANYAILFDPPVRQYSGMGYIFMPGDLNSHYAQQFMWKLYALSGNPNFTMKIRLSYDDGWVESFPIRLTEANNGQPATLELDINGGVIYTACDAQPAI